MKNQVYLSGSLGKPDTPITTDDDIYNLSGKINDKITVVLEQIEKETLEHFLLKIFATSFFMPKFTNDSDIRICFCAAEDRPPYKPIFVSTTLREIIDQLNSHDLEHRRKDIARILRAEADRIEAI